MARQEASLPVYCTSLVEVLRLRAQQQPDELAYRFLPSGQINGDTEEWTYGELDRRARTIAAQLQEAHAEDERALLLYPPGLEFISAFLGCLYARVVAVPAYPPHPTRLDRTLPRLQAIAQDSGARFILTTRSLANNQRLISQAPEMADACWIATDQLTEHLASAWRQPELTGETLTFLQYTSGSTGQPKGVINTHANLLHNERLIAQRFGSDSSIHVVGWLPLFHDMGLIGNVLHPLYLGASCTLMSPLAFLQRPMRWLEAISHFRGNISGGPNFAYDLCARKAQPHELGRLDLSSWAVAYNGSEPIRKETLDRFAATFAPCGFRPEAFYPCYGLAEATLFVTGIDRDTPPSYLRVKTEELERNLVVDAPPDDAAAKTLVSTGSTGLGQRVVIVNADTQSPCPPQTVGEIWVSGPSIARGYWNRPEESAHTFGARLTGGDATHFLRTGDLGFMVGGQLFITGRLKDLIILRGRNLYPQDIELTVERAHPAVRSWSSAAFSIEVDGEERLGLVAEADLRGAGAAPQEVIDAIRLAVTEEYGAHVYAILLIKPRTIPKTSSGKIKRHACRKGFLKGGLEILSSSVVEGLASPELEAAGSAPSLADELRSADVTGRLSLIQQLVQRQIASSLRRQPAGIDMAASPARLGIDSLMGIELQSRLEAALDLSLPDAFLWQQSTGEELIKNLAAAWEAQHEGAGKAEEPDVPIEPGPLEGGLPLSSGQQRLLLLENLAAGTPVYNVHFGLRITGALDVELLRRSLEELINRHAVLRTVFSEVNGQPCQIVRPQGSVDLVPIDLRSVPEAEREGELHRVATSIAFEPFDLETGPLMRTHLVMLAEGEQALLVTQHHLITDGWSIAQLAADLAATYKALAHKSPPPPMPRLQFADYARWERADQTRWEPHRSYWKQQLAGLSRLDLPADRPGSPHRSYRGGRIPLRLAGEAGERLSALGREEGCTLFVTLLAGYAALLHRYTGQEDFAVGSVIANRARAELRDVIGFFANTVALRCGLSDNPSFRELLRRTQATVAEAMRHGELPFGDVVQAAGTARDGDDNPLFQTSFIFESNPLHPTDVAGMSWQPLSWAPDGSVKGTAKFDLSLVLEQTPEGLAGMLEYSSDRFEPQTIRRMAGHLQTLLTGVAENPDHPLGMLPILAPEEQHRMLVEWNSTATEVPRDMCFQQLFERQAAQTPNALAAIHDGHRLTYEELNGRANQLARYLRNTGVGPDVIVALFMRRGIDLLTAILAAFKAGGAYLPLDPDNPAQRHFQVLNQSKVARVITTRDLAPVLEGAAENAPGERRLGLFYIEDLATLDEAADNLPPLSAPSNLAYVIYTSGSTGVPKGAMVEHRGMLNHLYAKLHELKLASSDVVAQTASQCFDISVWQFLSGLLVGGCVHIIREDVAIDPRQLFETIAEESVTILEIVPSLLRAMLEELKQGDFAEPDLRSLRWLLLTGEALPPELVRQWLERYPMTSILNAYGPTECSDDVAHYAICDMASLDAVHTPIGHPILNTRLYILDPWIQPVPVGVPGELYVGGICVGRGYLGDPIRTAQAFAPDPFTDGTTSRLYRTGDLARYSPDGNIVFLGRLDFQVKIRGFRIELGEIESALQHHPAVAQAVVIAHQDASENKRLVAYLLPRRPTSAAEIREALRQRLPDYMVPSLFIMLESMPLTPNGKIDRRALPAPPSARDDLPQSFTAPRTPTEQLLAQLWADLLGLDRVGLHDNFFALGGHSLLATQVMARLRAWLAVDLPLRALFEHPSVAQLARRVELAAGQAAPLPPILPVTRDRPLALSFAQQRLWFLDQLAPGDPSYNVPAVARLRGAIDVATLARSLRLVVARHEALRTTFAAVDGQPVQLISPAADFDLQLLDLQAEPEADPLAAALPLAAAEARRPFTLARGPLLRVALLTLGPDDHLLLLTLHHIISDAWSLGVLLREVSAFYDDAAAARPSALPDLPIQYADFAHWQRLWLAGDRLDALLAFWSSQLKGAPPALDLPTDFPRPNHPTHAGAYYPVALPEALVARLQALSRRHRATLYMTLLAAFQTLLYRYSRQPDFCLGSPIAGRTRTEVEPLIGFFVNTLVLRADLGGRPSFAGLLARTKEVTLAAYAHQELPFEKLVEALAPERDLGRTPLFQAMFILQNAPLGELRLGAAELQALAVSSGTAKFDLTLSLEERGGGLEGYLEYSSELFAAESIGRMVRHYEVLLAGIVEDEQASIDVLPLLTAAERELLIEQWSGVSRPLPSTKRLHELFEEYAERMPDAVAVASSEGRLKYAELNRQANRMAAHLRRLGVGPEVAVGILLEPSIAMVVGVLGILKAGGGYVPIDPSFPKDRINFILADSGVSVLLTRGAIKECVTLSGVNIFCMDEDAELLTAYDGTNLQSDLSLENQVYTIYTSGSTGRPKGVVVEQRQILNYLYAILNRFELKPGAQYAMLQPLAVDSCNTVFIPSLCAGGTLHVMPPDQAADPYMVLEYFRHHRMEVLKIAPSHLSALVDACPTGDLLPYDVLALGGEASHWDWVRGTLQPLAPPTSRMFIHYGPTETTVGMLTYCIQPDSPRRGPLVPLGYSLPNTRVYILGPAMQPVPIGVAGEIYIGGDCVARGYLNRPELTAERFTPDPFSEHSGARLYRTGDLARWLPGGEVEFLGRTDYQVKIRGFRIELNEIDAVLSQHAAVEKAITIARENGAAGKRIVAYVVPKRAGASLSEVSAFDAETLPLRLRAFLKGQLPEYMIPSNIVVLDTLPLSPQGKVNLRALPEPAMEVMPHDRLEMPRTLLQAQLVEIWEEVLNTSPISITDDFFQIGGHSLLAVRMMAMIRNRLKRTIPLASLLRNPTIANLAKLLAQSSDESVSSVLVDIQPEGDGVPFFCVHPVGGSVFCYADLARALGRERPFYGLQAPAPDAFPEDTLPASGATIEQIAALYIREIQGVRPGGPYLLGGWSMGGLIAFEMARQLNQQGERVGTLALFDTHLPPQNREAIDERDELPILTRFAADMRQLIGKDHGNLQEQFCSLDLNRQRVMLADVLKRDGVLAEDAPAKELDDLLSVFTRNAMAVDRHCLQPGQQRIVLFRAAEANAPEQLAQAWGRWAAGGVDLCLTPGDHYSMLRRPNVSSVAERLKVHLQLSEREQVS
jgi:amino acid adenylation domain-containing protein